jgi:hypothetical protein
MKKVVHYSEERGKRGGGNNNNSTERFFLKSRACKAGLSKEVTAKSFWFLFFLPPLLSLPNSTSEKRE